MSVGDGCAGQQCVCSLSVIPQDKWLPWSSGIVFGCLWTCVIQHFPLITTVTPLLQHLMLFLSKVEEDLPFLISVSITRALSHGFSLNSLQLMRLPLYNSCSRRAGFIPTTSFSWILLTQCFFRVICSKGMCNQLLSGWTHIMDPYWSHVWPNQVQE